MFENFVVICQKASTCVRGLFQRAGHNLFGFAEDVLRKLLAWRPEDVPSPPSLYISVTCFGFCIIYLMVAAANPSHRLGFAAVAAVEAVALLNITFVAKDAYRYLARRRPNFVGRRPNSGGQVLRARFRRNRFYTTLTAILTLIGIPLLYELVWSPKLGTLAIHQHEDTVTSVYFPSIAIWQRSDWTSQPNITLEKPPKCFLGWHTEDTKPCRDVDAGTTCKCNENWAPEILESFVWKAVEYRVAVLWSGPDLLCVEPTSRMLAQIYFTYNTTKALQDAGRILGPSLFVSIFDPTLDLLEALQKNYTRLEHMPANGLSTVTLGLHHRQALNEPGKYDYELSISSTPSMDLRCDSSAEVNMEMACWMTIFLSFPSFSRRVTELNYKMSLTDVLAEAGAWFSLFQMIAWLVSTQAFE